MYNQEKIEKFNEYTLEDYNRSLIVEEIANVKTTDHADKSFIQIGIRLLLDDDIFTISSFHEYLPGAGRVIAIGERDFLIKTIMEKVNKKEIELIKFNEDIKEIPKYIEFSDAIILISTKFYVEVFTKLMNRIDYEERHPRLDYRYKIISVPEKVLGNKIIIVGKDAILWEKQLFDNKPTEKKEKIDIKIKSASGGKVDITIRSVNKIKSIDTNLIRILEVED